MKLTPVSTGKKECNETKQKKRVKGILPIANAVIFSTLKEIYYHNPSIHGKVLFSYCHIWLEKCQKYMKMKPMHMIFLFLCTLLRSVDNMGNKNQQTLWWFRMKPHYNNESNNNNQKNFILRLAYGIFLFVCLFAIMPVFTAGTVKSDITEKWAKIVQINMKQWLNIIIFILASKSFSFLPSKKFFILYMVFGH